MVTRLGTILGTQLGTDVGSFGDGPAKLDMGMVYALSGFTTADRYGTLAGGGEAGLDTGFGVLALAQLRFLTGASACFAVRSDGASDGYFLNINTTNAVNFQARATASFPGSARFQFNPSDVGRLFLIVGLGYPGSNRIFVARAETGAPTTRTGYVPNAGLAYHLATLNSSQPASGLGVLAEAAFRGSPSDAQLLAVYDAVRAYGDIPPKAAIEALMPGSTVTHRWSLRDTLQAVNAPVSDGAAAPTTLVDTVTLATVDAMTKVGSPVVRVIDPGAYPRTSYGVLGFDSASRLQTANGAGFRGSAAGFALRLPITFFSIAAGVEYYAACNNPATATTGWSFTRSGATLTWRVADASFRGVDRTLTASDLGMPHLLHLVYDGAQLEAFWDGVSLGKSTAGGFTPAAAGFPMTLGGLSNASFPAATATQFGFAGSNSIATAAEVAADFAAWQRTQRLEDIPGKPDADRYEFSLDVAANGGPQNGFPAVVFDRVGTSNLSRVGTGLVATQRTERLWSYETSPTMVGARNWSAANYFSGAMTGFAHTSTDPFWFLVALIVHAKTGSASQYFLSKGLATALSGIQVYGQSTWGSIGMSLGLGGSVVTSPNFSIAATDLGRPIILAYQWTGSVLQAYAQRLKNGSDVTAATFSPYTGNLAMGRNVDTATNPASDAVTVLGVMGGAATTLTLAEYQGAYDAFLATEDVVEVPGKTARLWSLRRTVQANGGALAALVDQKASGESLALVGAPTVSNLYSHA